jgi:hypothetical protein
MKKANSKKFIIISISLACALVTGIIIACGGDYDYENFLHSFFSPETSGLEAQQPFFRSTYVLYNDEQYNNSIHDFDSTNVAEWYNLFQEKVTARDLRYLVYQSRIGEIDSLIFYVKDNTYPARPYLKKNTLMLWEDKAMVKEFLFYLGFAKRCEPYATFQCNEWDEEAKKKDPRKNTVLMQRLIEGGKKSFANAKTDFIKQRYLFQLVRLLFNAANYDACIAFYNENAGAIALNNSIKYRTMGYAAGAWYKQKNYSQANYIYAMLYDQCSEMRYSAFLSFHPQEEADWNGCLQLARSGQEKMALWHLLGVYADPLRAMKEIYKLDPSSDLLDLLLVRAVNIDEENFIPRKENYKDVMTSFALKTASVNKDLLAFLKKVSDARNTHKPYLWDLTTGYLLLATSDYQQADKYLTRAFDTDNRLIREQVRVFRLISSVEQYIKPDTKTETFLIGELTWLNSAKHEAALRSQGTYLWALHRLSEKYRVAGDIVKAQCLDYLQDRQFYNDPDKMKELIALIDKPNKTPFEQFVLTIHPYSRKDIFEYQAVGLLYQHKYREALDKFDECEGSGDVALRGDPFIIHINDCHDCDHEHASGAPYTKYTFVKRLVELSEFATGNAKKASETYYLLANGLYNMTYYGNARIVNDTRINIPSDDYSVEHTMKDPFYDCSKALNCYKKAMEMSPDKEFTTECCFMAAKCEQNWFFTSGKNTKGKDFEAGVYFHQLQKDFSKTDYYKEIIKECGYFRMFAGN